ncbi:tripartite tricarboxylate transporter substrate binding protein [Roseomonas eburnea]|uniref:Tripartite tricarboxylate transporter substrate binding protein n=1 Tax=Neoroseomonas eburnea TaxID=1346889 RepID=A0A9X9XBK7_9PROT|nr:tripartite tricarboxylate transporter substrate binding protein [Neoroseomonas eburnea]MBR0681093.1 tripartite tricarboxylate transporter substrate binding protein [Neoroseomonas eburnea]
MTIRIGRRALVAGLAALPAAAIAQDIGWPSRPLRIVYPFAPGGGDFLARAIAEKLRETIGQSVVVENRPGANTMIAAEHVARSDKDGYTIGWVATSTLVMNPNLYPNIPYRLEDFATLRMAYRAPVAFAVSAALPIRTVQEAIAHMRAKPGEGVGSVGNGSSPHVFIEMMAGLTGVSIESVAYRGEAAIVSDLMAGRVPFYAGSTNSLLPHREGGRFRILAVSAPERLAVLPEVPTFREAVHPDLVMRYWHGLVLPAGVPQPVRVRLADAIGAILRTDFLRQRATPDMELADVALDDFAALIRDEQARYGRVIRERNITVQS